MPKSMPAKQKQLSNHNEQVILLNKPFQVMCQFSPAEDRRTLKDFMPIKGYYPCGRLDYDSEGLLVLSANGRLQALIADPRHKQPKTYWVQVEGEVTEEALLQLCQGVTLKDGLTLPAQAERILAPETLWPRQPPIRERKNIPTSWLSLTIREGKNRQVRRMTAACGFPTLRLIRAAVGDWTLDELAPGQWCYAGLDSMLQQQLLQPRSQRNRRRPQRNRHSSTTYKADNKRKH